MILNIDNVSFRYNSSSVLDGISFEVPRGEILAILGPNGVGKTTLLKCINAVLRPSGGAVFVDRSDVRKLDSSGIAKLFGYVAQKVETGRLTAFDAVLMGRHPHIRWQVSDRDLEVVDGIMRQLDLSHLSLRTIDRMSGGEVQKVSIARALAQEPSILLLDEPTSSLDLKNQTDILQTIRKVVREHEVAAVMTMHGLNSALRFADRFIFLKDGKVFSAVTRNDVTAGIIENVYGLPVEMGQVNGLPVVLPAIQSTDQISSN